MATRYPKLEELLKNKALLSDEIRMWLRLGMYITIESRHSPTLNKDCVSIYDGQANQWPIDEIIGHNLRMQVLRWWEVEREHPRCQEVIDSTGLSALENRSG